VPGFIQVPSFPPAAPFIPGFHSFPTPHKKPSTFSSLYKSPPKLLHLSDTTCSICHYFSRPAHPYFWSPRPSPPTAVFCDGSLVSPSSPSEARLMGLGCFFCVLIVFFDVTYPHKRYPSLFFLLLFLFVLRSLAYCHCWAKRTVLGVDQQTTVFPIASYSPPVPSKVSPHLFFPHEFLALRLFQDPTFVFLFFSPL